MTVLVNEHRLIDMEGLRLLSRLYRNARRRFLPGLTQPDRIGHERRSHAYFQYLLHTSRERVRGRTRRISMSQIWPHPRAPYYPGAGLSGQAALHLQACTSRGTWLNISRERLLGPHLRVGPPSEITPLPFPRSQTTINHCIGHAAIVVRHLEQPRDDTSPLLFPLIASEINIKIYDPPAFQNPLTGGNGEAEGVSLTFNVFFNHRSNNSSKRKAAANIYFLHF